MEALRYAKEWGIDPDTLPDYPQWEPIEEIDPSPSGVGADQRRMIRTLLDSGEPMEKITSAFDLDIADVESIRDADTDA